MVSKREKSRREIKYSSAKERVEKHESGFESTSVRIPDESTFFAVKKAGVYRLDVIPYVVGKGNPYADEGQVHYERTYYTHRGIGAAQNTYTCPLKTFGHKCPICEDVSRLSRDPASDEDMIKALRPKERQLFLVRDLAETDKGVQIWDISYHLFGKKLDGKIKDADEDEGYEHFYHLDNGMTLKCSFDEEKGGGYTFFTCSNIEMKPRKEPLEESLLDEVPCLDDLLIETEYTKLKKIYLQEQNGEEEEEIPPARGAKKSTKAVPKDADDDDNEGDTDSELEDEDDKETDPALKDDEGSDIIFKVGSRVEHDDYGECEVTKVSDDGTSLTLEDEDGKIHKGVKSSHVWLMDEDEEEDEPKAKKGKSKAKDDEDEDEPEDPSDLEDDEDDEPPPVKKRSKK